MEFEESINSEVPTQKLQKRKVFYEWRIVWSNIAIFVYIHLAAIYGLYVICFQAKRSTIIWAFAVGAAAKLGITAGVHRLWSHRSYKAKWPLRLVLMIFQSAAHQNCIYEWVRDHRAHHKFIDTDADPQNANRGFFFTHIGWLLIRKHPDVMSKGATVDCSDLEQDPFVVFQRKWYKFLMPLCCFILPTLIPHWAWNETVWFAWHVNICRYCVNLNTSWLLNSAAHKWGLKPYDKSISSTNNVVVNVLAFGEGWHNYHHVFPWDYKTPELGNCKFNLTTAVIELFASFGLAYDLKTVDADMIRKRTLRTGNTD